MHRSISRILALSVALIAVAVASVSAAITIQDSFCRGGQTFLHWSDPDTQYAQYHVYRYSEPITAANLSLAQLVDANAPLHSAKDLTATYIATKKGQADPNVGLRISDLGTRLDPTDCLRVYTVNANAASYYAILGVDDEGNEDRSIVAGANSLAVPVNETVGSPSPVLDEEGVTTANGNDYPWKTYNWFRRSDEASRDGEPTKVTVTLPGNDMTRQYAAMMFLHHYQWFNEVRPWWATFIIAPCDYTSYLPDRNNSWWYGYSNSYPNVTSGMIVNYTEVMLMHMLDWAKATWPIDNNRVFLQGGSMGGTGAISFGFRHPDIFAGIVAEVPQVNPGLPGIGWTQDRLKYIWGDIATNQQTNDGDGVWDRMNMTSFAGTHTEDLPFLKVQNSKNDPTLMWFQIPDFYRNLNSSRQGFICAWGQNGHTTNTTGLLQQFVSFNVLNRIRLDSSYVAVSNSSANNNPGNGDPNNGDSVGQMNAGYDWNILSDTAQGWSADIKCTLDAPATADISARRLQAFTFHAGEKLDYTLADPSTGSVVTSGHVRALRDRFFVIPQLQFNSNFRTLTVVSSPVQTVIPAVNNLTALQRTDGSEMVDISYDLVDPDSETVSVSVKISSDGGTTYSITPAHITGDLGSGVAPGLAKHIVWDAGTDIPGAHGTTYVVSITADDSSDAATAHSANFSVANNSAVVPGISIGAPSGSLVTAGPVTYTVTYANATAVTLSAADITLNKTGTANGTVSVSGSGNDTRTVTISNITGDGKIGISVAASTASNRGLFAPSAGPSATFSVVNNAPSVSIGAPSVAATRTGPVTYTITYSGTDTVTLTAANVRLAKTGTAKGTVSVNGTGAETRTVTISNISGDGTLGISIAPGTGSNVMGKTPGTGPSATVTVDNQKPTVTVGLPSVKLTRGGPVTFNITYAGASTVTLANANVTLNKTGSANGTVAVSGEGSATRTVTISDITGNGTLGITLAANTGADAAGNQTLASLPSKTVVVDNAAPAITIGTASRTLTKTSSVTYKVTYDSAKTVNLTAANITLNKTGTANGVVTVSGSGNKTRTVKVSGITGDGTMSISLAAGTAVDEAGNQAAAANSGWFVVDNTPPSVTIGAPSVTDTQSGPVAFTITYAGASSVRLSSATVVLQKTGTAKGTVQVSGTGNQTRTVTISRISGSGTLGISVKAGTASDSLGNVAPASAASATVNVGVAH